VKGSLACFWKNGELGTDGCLQPAHACLNISLANDSMLTFVSAYLSR
jgi:hypothetical protein